MIRLKGGVTNSWDASTTHNAVGMRHSNISRAGSDPRTVRGLELGRHVNFRILAPESRYEISRNMIEVQSWNLESFWITLGLYSRYNYIYSAPCPWSSQPSQNPALFESIADGATLTALRRCRRLSSKQRQSTRRASWVCCSPGAQGLAKGSSTSEKDTSCGKGNEGQWRSKA